MISPKCGDFSMILEHTAVRTARLLSILRSELSLSSGLVKRLKWQNAFFVDGQPAHTDLPVKPGQHVTVLLRETVDGFEGEDRPLDILYEDELCIAVDKPAGILVHPSPNRNSGTLANALLGYYQRTGQSCGIHPVTRLDRDTFGVVLFAKYAYAHEQFRALLQSGNLHKTYIAPVYGTPPAACGEIDLPLTRVSDLSLLRTVDPSGKPCRTRYTLLRCEGPVSILQLEPLTGRTHQLRVHCCASGFPILGDPQYFTPASRDYSLALGLTTQQLCASRLAFRHPQSGAELSIDSRQNIRYT